MASLTQPIKQYEIFQPGHFQTSKFEIRQNGHTILHTKRKDRFLKSPDVHIMSPDGTILAACILLSWSRNQHLYLGSDPDNADKSNCTLLDCEGFTAGKYKFFWQGREYVWIRTHAKEHGASRWNNKSFKLVGQATGQVLSVFKFNSAMFKHGRLAEIDYFVELGQQLELMSMAAILGIELHIVRSQQAGNDVGSIAGNVSGIVTG
ncbi:uncharacterized protein LTR77_006491 [Saxophila tyrrhenica]|uniref:Uncharacterized protein n=1 Tax=Saxophila tyrrhenica TaxID=1690608 RepID=A0AAV9P8L9_9PEZI|nr:hypothetical protein LTR77_006491 [Saxophila tyrrhenica]